jgi:ATP-dependent RNA helicase DeaD
MFSATIAKEIASLAKRYQRDAQRIDTIRRDEAHGDIEYRAVRVAPNEIENAVVNLLRYFESPGALIFCATRERVRHLYGALRERGFSAVQLSGGLSQKERADALQSLRDGHARACVATDVAARGLDLPDLGLVIHADLPSNTAGLLHRSGRTGRAGKKGVSVVVVPHTKRRPAERLFAVANLNVEWSGPPLAEEIRAKDQIRLFEDPLLNEPPSPEELELAAKLLADRSPEAVAAALIRLHRSRLPAPEEMFDDRGNDRGGSDARGPRPDRGPERGPRLDHGSRAEHTPNGASTWFRLPVGRSKNADPKWLVPLICRLGHVTKKDIGLIKIFDNETKFEITREAEPRFREAIKTAADAGDIRINPAGAPGAPPPRAAGPRPERGPRPEGARPPYAPRPQGGPRPDRGPRPGGPPKKPFKKRAPNG